MDQLLANGDTTALLLVGGLVFLTMRSLKSSKPTWSLPPPSDVPVDRLLTKYVRERVAPTGDGAVHILYDPTSRIFTKDVIPSVPQSYFNML